MCAENENMTRLLATAACAGWLATRTRTTRAKTTRLWRMMIDIGNSQAKYSVLGLSEHLQQQNINYTVFVVLLFVSKKGCCFFSSLLNMVSTQSLLCPDWRCKVLWSACLCVCLFESVCLSVCRISQQPLVQISANFTCTYLRSWLGPPLTVICVFQILWMMSYVFT